MDLEFFLAAAIGGVIGGVALALLLWAYETLLQPPASSHPSQVSEARWFLGMG